MTNNVPITKREKRIARAKINKQKQLNNQIPFTIKSFNPITPTQEKFFNSFSTKNIVAIGAAGSGKSFLALYLALEEIMEGDKKYKKVVIVRSAVPTRDIGFLKGGPKEKMEQYEVPYYPICSELFGRGDAYTILKNKNLIEFLPTSFVRGTTFDNCIVIFEEFQNCTFHEIDSVITRMGENSKIILTGDNNQNDLKKEETGFVKSLNIFKKMKSFAVINFEIQDVVRSGFVKEYLTQKYYIEENSE